MKTVMRINERQVAFLLELFEAWEGGNWEPLTQYPMNEIYDLKAELDSARTAFAGPKGEA